MISRPAVHAAPSDRFDISIANWKFQPSTIVLHVGKPASLHIVSKEGVHGIASDALGIAPTTITPDGADITTTPKKAGTYVLHCAIFCGAGHADLALTVKVEP